MKNLRVLIVATIVLFAFSTLISCDSEILIENENTEQSTEFEDFQASNKDEEPDRDDDE